MPFEADPYNDDPGITIAEVNEERTVYLIAEKNADDPTSLQKWIKGNVDVLFENELMGWCQDDSLWPKKRTLSLFHEWFDVECHTCLVDTAGEAIIDDDL